MAALPVPDRARPNCQNCSTKGYDIVSLGNGAWAFTDGGYWALAVVNRDVSKPKPKYRGEDYHLGSQPETPRSITLVDAFEGPGYLKAVAEILSLSGATTVKYLIYSHQHTDHAGNGGALKTAYPKISIIGHERTAELLQKAKDPRRPVPDTTFTKRLNVQDAGLELAYHGPAHSVGDISIYHPASKTLMFVDVVFPRWVPFWNLAIAVDVPGFYEVHEALLGYDFKAFIGGHLTRLGDRADVEESYAYLKDVKATAQSMFAEVNNFGAVGARLGTFDPTSPNFGNMWETFRVLLDEGAKRCQAEVESRWLGKLGGVDVFTYSHCWGIIEAIRVDWAY